MHCWVKPVAVAEQRSQCTGDRHRLRRRSVGGGSSHRGVELVSHWLEELQKALTLTLSWRSLLFTKQLLPGKAPRTDVKDRTGTGMPAAGGRWAEPRRPIALWATCIPTCSQARAHPSPTKKPRATARIIVSTDLLDGKIIHYALWSKLYK